MYLLYYMCGKPLNTTIKCVQDVIVILSNIMKKRTTKQKIITYNL